MIDEKNLQDALVAAFEPLKSLHGTLSAVMSDVAALRETVLEKDAETIVRYQEHLVKQVAIATPLAAAAMQGYDEIILRLKDGGKWTN